MQNIEKKVLIISCYFPPDGGGGVQRTAKFVKYLPKFLWKPIVLTSKKHILPIQDTTLLEDIPSMISIVRTISLQPVISKINWKNIFIDIISIPDLSIWWAPFAAIEGLHQIRKEKVDVIYATGDPFSNFLIGYFLKLYTKKPLVIDFRDAWILDPRRSVRWLMRWRYLIEKILFYNCVKYADKIILATNSMKKDFQLHFKNIKSRDDFIAITNGFDSKDFKKIISIEKNQNLFNIVYTGSLQGGSRDPSYLFRALILIKKTQPDVYNKIKLYLVGNISNKYLKIINKCELEGCVTLIGYVSHYKSLGYLEMADALIFIMETQKNVRQITSGKIFEYIAFNKPVLALAHIDSDASDVILESNSGIFANPTDENDIKDKLVLLYDAWEKKLQIINPLKENVNKYSRELLTEKLASVFNLICSD